MSSAMVSSTFIWSLFGDTELKPPDIIGVPNIGVDVAADGDAPDEVNEKTEPDDDEQKPNGETPDAGAEVPNENPEFELLEAPEVNENPELDPNDFAV